MAPISLRPVMLGVLAASTMAPATPALASPDPVPEAQPTGKPLDCVPIRQIRSTKVRSDQIIDFEMDGGKVYRNTLPQSCPSLGFEQRFAYRTSISQLCSVDIITVLQAPGISPGPSCGLGQFQPVTIAKPPKK